MIVVVLARAPDAGNQRRVCIRYRWSWAGVPSPRRGLGSLTTAPLPVDKRAAKASSGSRYLHPGSAGRPLGPGRLPHKSPSGREPVAFPTGVLATTRVRVGGAGAGV